MFDRIKVDDPVGAISVHGTCGVWGTLAVGLFATAGAAEAWGAPGHGLFMGGGFRALLEQLIGVLAILGWVTVTAGILFFVIKNTIGLRVPENEELAGLDVQEHGIGAYPEFPTVAPGVAVEVSAGEELPAASPDRLAAVELPVAATEPSAEILPPLSLRDISPRWGEKEEGQGIGTIEGPSP